MPRCFRASIAIGFVLLSLLSGLSGCKESGYLSPTAIVATPDGRALWVACATDDSLVRLDGDGVPQQRVALTAAPTGLALTRDGQRLAVTIGMAPSAVCLVDPATGAVTAQFAAGHSAMAPVFSADGATLYVCDRFQDAVLAVETASGAVRAVIPVGREPVAAALTPDGTQLVVANHLHQVEASADRIGVNVTLIDTRLGQVRRQVELPNGAGLALGVAVSPDGAWAAVTHNLARYRLPTTQVERGWVCDAAVSLVALLAEAPPQTVLLDNVDAGAANPWAVAWTADGAQLVVSHAGTHEVSLIDFPALRAKLERRAAADAPSAVAPMPAASTDLTFLLGLRQRVPLRGNGPRALAVRGTTVWVANYFSDSLEKLDLRAARLAPVVVWAPAAGGRLTPERLGERAFNDAKYCFQGWLSCASCHSYTARVDGLNWDLLNDGIGNPKNAKSLLFSHQTPPAMSTGIRDSAEVAVRAGFRHIQFTEPPPEVPAAVDAYLKSLRPVPSPRLEQGRLSAAARRGRELFLDAKVGCAVCHRGEHYTDQRSYDVGTAGRYDPPGTPLDTPTLREVWRTAPYLHDGSAATLREVLTTRNVGDRHGVTSSLTPTQIEDLAAYVLSL